MAAAPILSLASTGLSAASSIMEGQGKAKADEFQAQEKLREAQYGRIKAAQTGEVLTRNLTTALGHISAVRASMGADPRSPTTAAIMSRQEAMGERTRGIEVGNVLAQASSDERASRMYTSMANQALMGSFLGAAGSVVGGLGGLFKSGDLGNFGANSDFWGGAHAAASDPDSPMPREPLTGRVAGIN